MQSYTPDLLDLFFVAKEKKENKPENIFIVMESSDCDLRALLMQGGASGFKEEHLKIIFYNTLCALKFLHSCNIIHRDLKPGNILVDADCRVMICDYGLARTIPASCCGKGSGDTRRIRQSIATCFDDSYDDHAIKKIIAKKLMKKRREGKTSQKRAISNHVGSR